MITVRPQAYRRLLQLELTGGVTVARLLVMGAALLSLFIDQSLSGVYQAVQTYAGGSLGASGDELPWLSIGYSTFYYCVVLLTPWLIERFSRKRIFSVAHFSFGIISFYLATTDSLVGFGFARCLQGLAQGTFFVCSVITVLTLFPAKLRGISFSIFSVTSLSGAALGPFIGGWFIDHAFWRDALAVYGLLAITAGIVIALLLEAPSSQSARRFDLPGAAFLCAAMFSLQYLLSFGERRDWYASADIIVCSAICAAAFAGFIWRELCEDRCGFIQLRLFHIRNLAVASVLGFGLGVPLFGGNLFIQYTESVLAFPPSLAGALFSLRILAIAIVAPTAVILVNADKLDVRVSVAVGFVLVPLSYAMLALQSTADSDFTTFSLAIVLSGAGFACLFSPIANVMVRSLPQDVRAEGIAIFKIVLLLGGSIASTALAVIYDHSVVAFQTLLASDATLRHFAQIGIAHPDPLQIASTEQQATVLAYATNSRVVALATLLNLPLVLLLRKPPAL